MFGLHNNCFELKFGCSKSRHLHFIASDVAQDNSPNIPTDADVKKRIDEAVDVAKIANNFKNDSLDLFVTIILVWPVHEHDHVRPPAQEEGEGDSAYSHGYLQVPPPNNNKVIYFAINKMK